MPRHPTRIPATAQPDTTVEVGGVAVDRITYEGELVATFAQVDKVHQRVDGTARRTFTKHRKRFVEGIDYIVVTQPDAMRSLGFAHPNGGTPASVTLITQRGYGKLVKPLNDKRAWEIQADMVDVYFGRKGVAADTEIPAFKPPTNMREALLLALAQDEQLEAQRAQLALQAPKVAAHDKLSSAKGWRDMQETAKRLGTGRTRLFAWMRDTGILIDGDLPRQKFIDAGYFKLKTSTFDDPHGVTRDYTKVMVSGKGLNWLAKRYGVSLQLDIDLDDDGAVDAA